MQFPDHYPDHCPPTDAAPAKGIIYHFVEAVPPLPTDCQSYYDQGIQTSKKKACRARGLSVYRDMDTVKEIRALRRKFRRMHVGEICLDEPCGMIKQTASQMSDKHMTWWVPAGVDPRSLVKRCAELE